MAREKYDSCIAIVLLGLVPIWDSLQTVSKSILDIFFAAGDFPHGREKDIRSVASGLWWQ